MDDEGAVVVVSTHLAKFNRSKTYQAAESLEHFIRSPIGSIQEISCKKNVIFFAISQLFIRRGWERLITILPIQFVFMSPPEFHPGCSRVMRRFSRHIPPESNKIQRTLSSVTEISQKGKRHTSEHKDVLPIGQEPHQKINVLLGKCHAFPSSAPEE
jgi:hypothetical protein